MKIQKGDAGYLRRRKRLLILEAVVSFGLVAALVIAGYVTTKTKLNLLTVVAVLGCLPASRILVNLIMVMPHDSIDEATELEISAVTEELTVAYDLVITSEKKAMPVAAVAIYNNTICGYVPVKKVDVDYAAKHIKSIMKQNQFDKVVVKLFQSISDPRRGNEQHCFCRTAGYKKTRRDDQRTPSGHFTVKGRRN